MEGYLERTASRQGQPGLCLPETHCWILGSVLGRTVLVPNSTLVLGEAAVQPHATHPTLCLHLKPLPLRPWSSYYQEEGYDSVTPKGRVTVISVYSTDCSIGLRHLHTNRLGLPRHIPSYLVHFSILSIPSHLSFNNRIFFRAQGLLWVKSVWLWFCSWRMK